nr:hypothetical protein [uncultured Methanobrevibacter sp.]
MTPKILCSDYKNTKDKLQNFYEKLELMNSLESSMDKNFPK